MTDTTNTSPGASPYRHILLDADNTILDFAVCEKRILEAMARDYGFMPRTRHDEDLTTCYRRINRELWEQLERGTITPEKLKIERFQQLVAELDFTAVARPVEAWFLNEQFIVRLAQCAEHVPTAGPVVAALARQASISIITNGFADVQRPRLKASGFMDHVAHVFISEEIGAAKPQPAFFQHVVSALGDPDPATCLVVGDSLTSDIFGGRAAGMPTVWFDRSAALNEQTPTPNAENTPDFRITRLVELKAIVAGTPIATGKEQP